MGPPSPRPSRSASEFARLHLPCLPHAPYVFARTPVPMYCYLLLLLGLLPYLLPSNRLIILYSYHYTYHVLLVITTSYTAIGNGLYITKTRCLRIYRPQYVHSTCSAIHHGWLCVPCEIADDKREWSFSFPIVLPFVVVLRILYWTQYVRTCSTRPFTMHGWLCLPCGIADKASCLQLF